MMDPMMKMKMKQQLLEELMSELDDQDGQRIKPQSDEMMMMKSDPSSDEMGEDGNLMDDEGKMSNGPDMACGDMEPDEDDMSDDDKKRLMMSYMGKM